MRSFIRLTAPALAGAFALVAAGACDQMPTQASPQSQVDGADLPASMGTTVPGHSPGHKNDRRAKKIDSDGNGIPDEGVVVNGHYTSVYAYDANGDWYWDLGDGRVRGTVGSVDALDQGTLTVCDYVNNYRADFGNDPFMDSGWIQNHINCHGHDDDGTYNYLIVHQSDPRYTGNPDWSIWGTWEYHALTISGFGNLVRPENHVGG